MHAANPASLGRHSGIRGLRFRFTAAILLVLVPSLAASVIGTNSIAVMLFTRRTKLLLKSDAELLSFGLSQWNRDNQAVLQIISLAQGPRQRDPVQISTTLSALREIYPLREWRFWTADTQPKLLSHTDVLTPEAIKRTEAFISRRPYFREALQGRVGVSVIKSLMNGRQCLLIAQPVYQRIQGDQRILNADLSSSLRSKAKPTGVVSICVPVENLGADTGLTRVVRESKLWRRGMGGYVDFATARSLNSVFLLITKEGHLLYPTADKRVDQVPLIGDFKETPWAPLFRIAEQARAGKEVFGKVSVLGQNYFVLTSVSDDSLATMLVLNEREAFRTLHQSIYVLLLFGFLTLLLNTVAIVWQCARVVAPVRLAGDALKRISEGDFDGRIVHERSDELGDLLDNINTTAARLKLFLSRETSHAITQRQIDTARDIQKDFLAAAIPHLDVLEIAPVFKPAYEVGADWYDAVQIDEVTYVVVADVCDKGIPSALYMAIFSGLVRYGLLSHAPAENECPSQRLVSVITQVNDFMAENYAESVMFATVFMAAIDGRDGGCHYVSAGHESPLLCSATEHRTLPSTGPAVGLFQGAIYRAGAFQMDAGDYLVAYTDGLVDARCPDGKALGLAAVRAFLDGQLAASLSAAELLEALLTEVRTHTAGAEQFDDLTVMVLRRRTDSA